MDEKNHNSVIENNNTINNENKCLNTLMSDKIIIEKEHSFKDNIFNLNDQQYIIIILEIENQDKIIIKLKSLEKEIINEIIYENIFLIKELADLFELPSKYINKQFILNNILIKYINQKKVILINNNENNNINLVFNIVMFDEEKMYNIELKQKVIKDDIDSIIKKIDFRHKEELNEMKNNFNNKLKELENEIKNIDNTINNHNTFKKIIKKENMFTNANPNNLIFDNLLYNFKEFSNIYAFFHLKDDYDTIYLSFFMKEIKKIQICKINNNLELTVINVLEGNFEEITIIRYFKDFYTNQEFLVATDRRTNVFLWEIINQNKFNLKKTFKINIDFWGTNDCLLFLTQHKKYLLVSSNENFNNILGFEIDNGNKIQFKNIYSSDSYDNCLLNWYNKYDNILYVIKIYETNLFIFNPLNEEIYCNIRICGFICYKLRDRNDNALIIYNKNSYTDLLIFANSDKYYRNDEDSDDYSYGKKQVDTFLLIFDLFKKIFLYKIDVGQNDVRYLIAWNNQMLFILTTLNELKIVDLDKKIINNFNHNDECEYLYNNKFYCRNDSDSYHSNNKKELSSIEKIIFHNKEVLLTITNDGKIYKWTIKQQPKSKKFGYY